MLADRLRKVKSLMRREGFESLFISPGPNLRYLTGVHYTYPGDPWDMEIVWDMITVAVISVDGEPILFAPRHNETWIKGASQVHDIRTYSGTENLMEVLRQPLGKMKGILGIEFQLPYRIYGPLVAAFPEIRMKSASEMLSEARLIKSVDEIECMRKAARIVENGVKVGREFIRESITEREVSIEVESAMRKQGAESISYCVVQTGAKTATWDPPSEDMVKKGDLFLMDLSATYNGYHADITRMTVVGKPSEKQKKVYAVVQEAQSKAIDVVRDGVRAGVINDAGRRVMDERGYGEHVPFGIGHGLGLEAHEMPHLTEYRDMEMALQPGIVMTVEPTINLPGEFGIRIEDDVLVTVGGREILTLLGRELVQI